MKNVFFDNFSNRKNRLLAIPMVVFMLIYIFTIDDRGSALHKIGAILGPGLFVVIMGKQFFFRNYLGWNKKGMTLKLNSFFSKTISFEHIIAYSFKNENLEIVRKNGSSFNFSLRDLNPNHIHRIREILLTHTSINNTESAPLP